MITPVDPLEESWWGCRSKRVDEVDEKFAIVAEADGRDFGT